MTPTALVGIVTYNRASILPKAIESALSQRNCQLKVAVIDDNSSDATSELPGKYPMVDWVRWTTNRGYMAARNQWMTSAREDYFVSLDDDAWFLQGDEIALAIEVLECNPKIAAVAFDILSPDRPDPVDREEPRPAALFIGCGHVLRLDAVRSVGVYEPTPGSYGTEEKDLCLRLMDAGYQIVKYPGVHVWHDKTPVARVIPAQYKSLVCNDLVMTIRRVPALLLVVALLSKLCQHSIFSWKRGLMKPCLRGFGLFAKSLPAVWRSRRPVKTATLRAYMHLSHR